MKVVWFGTGFVLGVTALSLSVAAVPKSGTVTDDTALYQNLSEIRVPKQARPNFDADIARLSGLEARHHERLPLLAQRPELMGPMKRVEQKKFVSSPKARNPVPQQAGRVSR